MRATQRTTGSARGKSIWRRTVMRATVYDHSLPASPNRTSGEGGHPRSSRRPRGSDTPSRHGRWAPAAGGAPPRTPPLSVHGKRSSLPLARARGSVGICKLVPRRQQTSIANAPRSLPPLLPLARCLGGGGGDPLCGVGRIHDRRRRRCVSGYAQAAGWVQGDRRLRAKRHGRGPRHRLDRLLRGYVGCTPTHRVALRTCAIVP